MVRHIDSELQHVRDMVLKMGGCVEKALEATRQGLISRDAKFLDEVRAQEKEINTLQMKVDELCVQLLAKQAPVAKDLRFVISVTKINTDLERMGDQTLNTARYGLEFFEAHRKMPLPKDLEVMFSKVIGLVRLGLDAFSKRDIEISRQVLVQDDEIDQLKRDLFLLATEKMKSAEWSIESGLQFVMIAKNLERLADHVTNVAEDVIFLATGEDIRHGQGLVRQNLKPNLGG
jgi:phosphate transport system protein